MRLIKSAMNKVCSNIEQKGVAQLLQIEEVRLKSTRNTVKNDIVILTKKVCCFFAARTTNEIVVNLTRILCC